jgi:hypothetical protein
MDSDKRMVTTLIGMGYICPKCKSWKEITDLQMMFNVTKTNIITCKDCGTSFTKFDLLDNKERFVEKL